MNKLVEHEANLVQGTVQQTKRKSSHLGLIMVVSALTVLMFILLAAVATLLFTNQFGTARSTVESLLTGTSPLDMVDIDQVDPALALASLGGVQEVDVIAEAIDKARPETALSAILFQPKLTDKESAGSFLLLAAAYGADSDGFKSGQRKSRF